MRTPAKYLPVMGIVLGAVGGVIYWLAAALWPSSIAIALTLFATTLIGAVVSGDVLAHGRPRWTDVFLLLITYNALMALTTAHLGFSVAANLVIGLVMICGQAASRGLIVSMMVMQTGNAQRVSGVDLAVALALGFAPAAILGIPGLIGLAAAIIVRLGLLPYLTRVTRPTLRTSTLQRLTEVCFYLGALAAWKYI